MSVLSKFNLFSIDFDKVLLITVIVLTIFGIYLQFDIATSLGDNFQMRMFISQMRSLFVAIAIFFIVFFIPNVSRLLHKGSFLFVVIAIGLLLFVLFYGQTAQGSTRWIRLPFFSFQPSQIAHTVLIVFYAKYLENKRDIIKHTGFIRFFKDFQLLIFITMAIIVLIYLERHLSTLIVLGLTLLSLLFIAGFKRSMILIMLLLIIGSFFLVINRSHDYRSGRMEIYSKYSLFHKALGIDKQEISADPYQVRESLTAISQGGIFGTGSERGRAKHKFLPDVNSDYIFAMIGEQFGFIGGMIVIALFSVFLFRTVVISTAADSFFTMMVAIGFGINIFITAIVNIGVSLSALPSTGLPLPFVSYGGSALAVNVGMLAVILNISAKKRIRNAK